MNEFDIIKKYFLPLTRGDSSVASLQDDAAVIKVPEGCELVVTSDTLNEGVHFWPNETPRSIAYKALRSNLSDLAAMAAKPLCYQLNMAFPDKPEEAWLKEFSQALQDDNARYDVFCSGGDTTSINSEGVSVSITAIGLVPLGKAVRRSGAQADDYVVLTGPVGQAYLGLQALGGKCDANEYRNAVDRYKHPRPRLDFIEIMQKYANAAADISDGLLADCEHIAQASGCGIEIDLDKIEFSQDVQHAIDEKIITTHEALSGGDDYELILTISESKYKKFQEFLDDINVKHHVIGRVIDSASGLFLLKNGVSRISGKGSGWKHF